MQQQLIQKLTKFAPLIVVGISIVLFCAFAFLRAQPQNTALPQYKFHIYGAHQARVYDVFSAGQRNAAQPLFADYDNLIFRGHNPGLFSFMSEVYVRLGAQTPYPIQLISIVMFVLGIVANYFWVKTVFNSRAAGAISASFLALSPYLLYHSVSIHADPYEFLFFNLTVLLFALYFKNRDFKYKRHLLVGALVSYFILTQNYYMFHVSTFLVVVGLSKLYLNKIFSKAVILMMVIAVISFMFTGFWVVMNKGGLQQGIFELQNQLLFWTIDENEEPTKAENGNNTKVVGLSTYLQLPGIITDRVQTMYLLTPFTFMMLFILAINLSKKIKEWALKYNQLLVFIFLGGMSWYVAFLQHSWIHKFSGIYSFFLWSTLLGISGSMVYQYLKTKPKLDWESLGFTHLVYALFGALTFLSLGLGFYYTYVQNMVIYLKNL